VMIADPVINSDGRDAFAQFNHQHRGKYANPDPADWSNDFNSWDARKYRTGHYYFDLNRDWFAHTHPETRNRAALLQEWRPQAGVDAHEMGSEREFYFDPPTDPVSPLFPEYTTKWFEEYGRAHADAFDREFIEYTKREMFNYFYPAYFTSYMTYQGAVGMLYEQGSSRGFAWELSDGTVRTLAMQRLTNTPLFGQWWGCPAIGVVNFLQITTTLMPMPWNRAGREQSGISSNRREIRAWLLKR